MTLVAHPSMALVIKGFADALAAAETYAGATAPNPPVGCVVLGVSGEVLSVAAHQQAGRAHAEAAALAACRANGDVERVDTLLVTLEPCNHHGRTPPCVDAILATPARTVWIAARDPNPAVAGGGAARLQAAGLSVHFLSDVDHPEAEDLVRRAERLIAPFALWSRERRPWLTVKQAINRRGDMVPPPGARTFTSEASLTLAHSLRRRADAIITGSGTILADAPEFTVRRTPDPRQVPRRLAILDRRRRTPPDYVAAAESRGFIVSLHNALPSLLTELAADGVLEALVESGPTLLAHFLESGLWDEQVVIRQAAGPEQADQVDVLTRIPFRA